MKTIRADECVVTYALTFILINLVNISLPVMFHVLQFLFKFY